jgi:hypothetical protein
MDTNDPEKSWNASCASKAMDTVLRALLGKGAPVVIPYAGNEEVLWSFETTRLQELLEKAKNGRNGIVIIWDAPSSSVFAGLSQAAEYLNPLTWALCAVRKTTDLSVTVLDFNAASHADYSICRVLQAIDPPKRPFRLLVHPTSCIAEYLAAPPKDASESKTISDLLAHHLRTILTERGEENIPHQLASYVGPMILMGARQDNPPPQCAVLSLLRKIELLQEGDGNTTHKEKQHEAMFSGQKVRLLLVDDQCDKGWEAWVKSIVDVEGPKCFVESTSTPETLVDALDSLLPKGAGQHHGMVSDCRFRLGTALGRLTPTARIAPPSQAGDASPQDEAATVLLLDLRLFARTPEAEEEEVRFVDQRVLPLCRRFTQSRHPSLARLGFSGKELYDAEQWCNKPTRKQRTYLNVLSLLPRLMALADFSLPIVLFSSTGQRRVIELLKEYGSIITDFAKPCFTGAEGQDLVEETEQGFRNALAKAANTVRTTRRVQEICSLHLTQYKKALAAFREMKYIEVFHEECRDEHDPLFRVGAFAVGFRSEAEAEALEKCIKTNGPVFYDRPGRPGKDKRTNPEWARKQWRDEIAGDLARAFQAAGIKSDQMLPFIVVSGDSFADCPAGDPLSLLDPTGLDNINQDLLRLLLEIMIIDTLAWISRSRDRQCNFFGATRLRCLVWRKMPTAEDVAMIKAGLLERWGIDAKEVSPGEERGIFKLKWQSLRPDSFFGPLNELASARSKSSKGIAYMHGIRSAYGIPLPGKHTRNLPRGFRHLHSIADIVVRVVEVKGDSSGVKWDVLESDPTFKVPLCGVAGMRSRIVQILNCHRALDEGDLVDGFGYGLGLRVDHAHDVAGNIVARRLKKCVPRLTGDDFIRIVRQYTDDRPRNEHSQPQRLPDRLPSGSRTRESEGVHQRSARHVPKGGQRH